MLRERAEGPQAVGQRRSGSWLAWLAAVLQCGLASLLPAADGQFCPSGADCAQGLLSTYADGGSAAAAYLTSLTQYTALGYQGKALGHLDAAASCKAKQQLRGLVEQFGSSACKQALQSPKRERHLTQHFTHLAPLQLCGAHQSQ